MFGLKDRMTGDLIAHRQEIGGGQGGFAGSRVAGLASGLIAGTLVATDRGWRPVESITPGDMVLTFDRGLQPVCDVILGVSWDDDSPCPQSLWPLSVPAGALGNREAMKLLPEQPVMVESDAAEMLFDDPFALLTAADLQGVRGIERSCPGGALEVIQLQFDEDEVVFANAGALVFCPSGQMLSVSDLLEHCAMGGYTTLPPEEAAMLVDCLCDEDAVAGGMPHAAGHQDYAALA